MLKALSSTSNMPRRKKSNVFLNILCRPKTTQIDSMNKYTSVGTIRKWFMNLSRLENISMSYYPYAGWAPCSLKEFLPVRACGNVSYIQEKPPSNGE